MNTFKTAVVLATLLGVGYGVHVVLNKPLSDSYQRAQAPIDEFGLPRLDTNGVPGALGEALANAAHGNGSLPSVQILTPGNAAGYQNEISSAAHDAIQNAASTLQAHGAGTVAEMQSGLQSGLAAAGHTLPDLSLNAVDFPELPNIDSGFTAQPNAVTVDSEQASLAPPSRSYSSKNADTVSSVNQFNNQYPQTPLPAMSANVQANDGSQPDRSDQLSESKTKTPFENICESAQAKIDSGQYPEALFTLSLWYSNPELTSDQRDVLIPLLDELAGKVIYSREHHLAAPHAVQPGETLAQIASRHAVTPEFLARINGLDSSTPLAPGQYLKVVIGPFRAELSLSNREITLFVGNSYAGRFSVGVGRDLSPNEMAFEVAEKSGGRPYVDPETNQQTVAGDPENPYGNYWIGLRSPGSALNPYLGLHSTGSRVEASDTRGCVTLSDRDADDLQAILMIGSRVTIHR